MGIFIPTSEKRPSKKVIRFDVFLNSSNGTEYESLKEKCKGKPLQNVDFQTAKTFQNNGVGVKSHLEKILKSKQICLTLDQL